MCQVGTRDVVLSARFEVLPGRSAWFPEDLILTFS